MSQKLIQVKLDEALIEAVNKFIQENNSDAFKSKITKTSLIAGFFRDLTKIKVGK
jgi:hypothetical protein